MAAQRKAPRSSAAKRAQEIAAAAAAAEELAPPPIAPVVADDIAAAAAELEERAPAAGVQRVTDPEQEVTVGIAPITDDLEEADVVRLGELGPYGVANATYDQRRFHPQPGVVVTAGGARAEDNRGRGNSDIVMVAVEPGHGQEVAALVERILDVAAHVAAEAIA